MKKFPERNSRSTTSTSKSVLDLETHKTMVLIVDPTSSMSDWSEGSALIGICNTAHLKLDLPITTSVYSGAAAPSHGGDDADGTTYNNNATGSGNDDGCDEPHSNGVIKADIEEAEAYCVSLEVFETFNSPLLQ